MWIELRFHLNRSIFYNDKRCCTCTCTHPLPSDVVMCLYRHPFSPFASVLHPLSLFRAALPWEVLKRNDPALLECRLARHARWGGWSTSFRLQSARHLEPVHKLRARPRWWNRTSVRSIAISLQVIGRAVSQWQSLSARRCTCHFVLIRESTL